MARYAPNNLKFVRGLYSGDSSLVYFTWDHSGDVADGFTIWGLDSSHAKGGDMFQSYCFPGNWGVDPAIYGSTREYGPINWSYFESYGVYWHIAANWYSPMADLESGDGVDAYASKVTNLAALSATATSITFRWDPPAVYSSPISGYQIWYRQSGVGSYNLAATVSGAPYTISGLTPGTTYDVMVKAVTNAGASAFADTYQSVIQPSTISATIPSEPTGVSASTPSPSNGSITITWSAPASDGNSPITGYTIQESQNGGGWTNLISDTGSTATSKVLTGYSYGGTYKYRVAAINAYGTSAFSLESNTVTPSNVPGAPTITTAISGNLIATLGWTLPADNGSAIYDYIIEYSTDNQATWTVYPDGISSARIRTLTGLSASTDYYFRISAKNSVGTGAPSPVRGPITPTSVPSEPLNLVASIDTQDINSAVVKLDWDPPATSNGGAISAYRIQVSKDNGVTWYRTLSSSDWEPWYYVTVDLGETYVFRVAAINFNGTGPYSSNSNSLPVMPPPPGTTPDAPANVAALPGNGKLTVSWDSPAVTGTGGPITEYKIQYSSDGGVTWTTLTETA